MRPAIEFAKNHLTSFKTIGEVGTWDGNHAKNMYDNLHPDIIYIVDIKDNLKRDFFKNINYQFINKYSREASLEVPDNLDLVYIDADHSELAVMIDIACWYPKIKLGGMLCGHDYGTDISNGVKSAVDRIFHGHIFTKDTDWWIIKKRVEGY